LAVTKTLGTRWVNNLFIAVVDKVIKLEEEQHKQQLLMMMSKPKEPWSTRRGRTTVAATAANQERGERQLCPQIITLASSRLKRLEASPDVSWLCPGDLAMVEVPLETW